MEKTAKKNSVQLKPPAGNIPDITDVIHNWVRKYPAQFRISNDEPFEPIADTLSRVTIDILYSGSKSPSIQDYPADYMSSSHCQEMSLTEFGIYNWILKFLWISDQLQCFMPYRIEKFMTICGRKITKKKFIQSWEKILCERFKFVKHNGEIYFYNERQFKEFMKQEGNRQSGGKGGKKSQKNRKEKALADKKIVSIKFQDSPFFDKRVFIEALKSDEYFVEVDHEHYYQKVLNWVKGKNPTPKSPDWMAQTKRIILANMKNGKNSIKFNSHVNNEKKTQIKEGLFQLSKKFTKP